MDVRTLNQLRYSHVSVLKQKQVVDMLKRDLNRVWAEVSLLLANENFFEVLELLAKADPRKAKAVEEIRQALLKITFYVLNL